MVPLKPGLAQSTGLNGDLQSWAAQRWKVAGWETLEALKRVGLLYTQVSGQKRQFQGHWDQHFKNEEV